MAGTALTLLVVEDDDDNRELLCEFLRFEGWEVEGLPTAEAALARVAERSFDALIVDVGLPGMDGLALARELRPRFPRLALVAVSGWGDGGPVAAARGREVDAVVVKPAEPARLVASVTAAVRSRRAGDGSP